MQRPTQTAAQPLPRPSVAKVLIGAASIMGSVALIGLALAIVLPKQDPKPLRRVSEGTSSTPAVKQKSTVRVENGVLKTTWPATPNESVRDVQAPIKN